MQDKIYCPDCKKYVPYYTKKIIKKGNIEGYNYNYLGEVSVCNECGAEILTNNNLRNNMEKSYEEYYRELKRELKRKEERKKKKKEEKKLIIKIISIVTLLITIITIIRRKKNEVK